MSETATMTPAPQRLRALERANAVRLARAELKRRIAEGEASAADVIMDPPDEALSWAIGELLMDRLRTLDKIAYVRFASVYRDFQDVEAFLNELKDLLQSRGK